MDRLRGFITTLFFLAAIAGGAVTAFWIDRTQRESAGLPELVPLPADLLLGTPAAPVEPAPVPVSRAPVAAEPARETIPVAPAVAPVIPMGTLEGRVLADDGHPLPQAVVEVLEITDGAFRLPRGEPVDRSAARAASTDEEGRFRLEWPDGRLALVLAHTPGFAPSAPTTTSAGAQCELVLSPGIELHGTVTDAEGAPVSGATVRVLRGDEPVALAPATITDAAGAYALDVDPRPGCVVEVVPLEGAPSDWLDLPAGDESRRALDVVLEPGWVLEGLVRDAETARPLAGATVAIGSPLDDLRSTTTDSSGAFALAGLGGSATRLRASAPGHAPVELSRLPAPDDGAARIELVLERGRALSGRVVDETGAPVPGASVTAVAARQGATGTREQREGARTDASGRFQVDHLALDLVHALLVSKPGYASSVWDLPSLARETTEHGLGDVVLRPAARLAGLVRAPDGKPVGEVRVVLEGSNHDRPALRGEAEGSTVADPVGPRAVRSDAAGRFWFVDVPPGRFRISAGRDGAPTASGLTIDVAAGSPLEGLELVLDASAFVAGRVLDPADRPLENATVFARAVTLDHPEAAAQLAQAHVRTDSQGRFALTGLAAGEYVLHAQPGTAPEGSASWLPVALAGVRTGRDDLVLRVEPGARVAGTLLDASGAAVPGWIVSTTLAEGHTRTATTDPDGRFELLVPSGTPCVLEVRGAPGTAAFERVALRKADVEPDGPPLELRLPHGGR